jgi:hypothetical protein
VSSSYEKSQNGQSRRRRDPGYRPSCHRASCPQGLWRPCGPFPRSRCRARCRCPCRYPYRCRCPCPCRFGVGVRIGIGPYRYRVVSVSESVSLSVSASDSATRHCRSPCRTGNGDQQAQRRNDAHDFLRHVHKVHVRRSSVNNRVDRLRLGTSFALPSTSTSVHRNRDREDPSSVSVGSPVVSIAIL